MIKITKIWKEYSSDYSYLIVIAFEETILYLMNSIQHRHILFLPNTSFTSSFSHPVHFLLYGDIEYSLFNRIPMDNVGYLYGSLALENNQLIGEIYLDAIAEETMIQSLFSHINELNDNTLNNILNTISFTVIHSFNSIHL